MYGIGFGKSFMMVLSGRQLHTVSSDGPAETLKRRIMELEKMRRTNKKRNPKKGHIFVEIPESLSFFDTATMPMILNVVGTALFAKLLMMEDVKNWAIDMLTDALTRVEESVNAIDSVPQSTIIRYQSPNISMLLLEMVC